jgi:hypothetical protein
VLTLRVLKVHVCVVNIKDIVFVINMKWYYSCSLLSFGQEQVFSLVPVFHISSLAGTGEWLAPVRM